MSLLEIPDLSLEDLVKLMYPLSLIVTLILIYIVFLFIMFLVYFKYMHGIVLVTFEFIYEFIEHSIQYSSELSSRTL